MICLLFCYPVPPGTESDMDITIPCFCCLPLLSSSPFLSTEASSAHPRIRSICRRKHDELQNWKIKAFMMFTFISHAVRWRGQRKCILDTEKCVLSQSTLQWRINSSEWKKEFLSSLHPNLSMKKSLFPFYTLVLRIKSVCHCQAALTVFLFIFIYLLGLGRKDSFITFWEINKI